jgi:hypothetical protein
MTAFDNNKQHMVQMVGIRKELGSGVTIASVSGQTFTVATKLRKVKAGHGVMDTDGMPAVATTGIVTNGQVTFTRKAPIATSADTMTYELYGY